ncbi:hypothetical protein [Cellulomonas alba]|uniref:Uncharacterized protein n=1 Tax=Cellulomonas alba TaxID=3053467 RepID=A0ABT7SG88_9CELL|nr:hypothetical protein [Cellulomonas alba]MDM7855151.1 hypothetical protein [Cellulomonas alba]
MPPTILDVVRRAPAEGPDSTAGDDAHGLPRTGGGDRAGGAEIL